MSKLVVSLTKDHCKYNPDTIVGLLNLLRDKIKEESSDTESDRCSLFPIEDMKAFKFYKQQEAMIWNNSEMEFSADRADYEGFSDELKTVVDKNFAFFSFSDGRVIENIMSRLMMCCNTVEQRLFYGVQLFIEQVHSEFYSKTIDSIIPDPEKRLSLHKALDRMPVLKKKDEWMTSYMEADLGPAYVLLPYICVEGIFFQAGFIFILWFKVIGKMNNVVFGNIQVRKDEAVHRNFGIYKYLQLPEEQRPPKEHVVEIIKEAVDLEIDYLYGVIPHKIEYRHDTSSKLPDAILDPADIENYIKVTGNDILTSLGYSKYWDVSDLPPWIEEISMETKNNFYETRGGNYTSFSLTNIYTGRKDDHVYSDDMYANPDTVDF